MPGPTRRRPGENSPIKLVAQVETVSTTGAMPEITPLAEPRETPRPVRAKQQPSKKAEATMTVTSAVDPTLVQDDTSKTPITISLRTSLKKQAETAVLRTAGYPGGHQSFSGLVDHAIEQELRRLAEEFNSGEPFPRNAGAFRQGRPLGS
ncbi:MAG: hypothetical protein ACOH1J_08125 [Microbacteriaceae bacterium]